MGDLEVFLIVFLNGPRLSDLEVFLLGNCDDEALRRSDRVLVVRLEKGCRLVKQTGPGSRNVRIEYLVGLVDGRIIRGFKTKVVVSYTLRHSCQEIIYVVECIP